MTAPRKPQDRQAKNAAARKAEATGEKATVSFEFGGRTYTVGPESYDNVEMFEAIEDEKYITATRGLLGAEQWAAFKDDHREGGRVPMAPAEEFLSILMGAIGQGNS